MTRQVKLFTYAVTAFLIGIFVILSNMTGGGAQFASAAALAYSDALADLRTDASFTVDDYPAVAGDYKLEVIQVAESEQGELLIYVYQPAARQDVQACTICIAREPNGSAGLAPIDYALEYLNNNGVFFKYRVKDFELKEDAIRYYNISNILRPFDKLIDDPTGNDNTVSEVPYRVGQFWTACAVDGKVTYTMAESEVIEITEKYVGHVIYDEGHNFGFTSTNSATAAHFVAFSTDKPIDKLMSASVRFNERDVTYQFCGNAIHSDALNGHAYKSKFNYQYGTKQTHDPVKITSKCQVSDIGTKKYTMDRIRTASDFFADAAEQEIRLTSGDPFKLKNAEWVLSFYETPMEAKTNGKEWVMFTGWGALLNGTGDIDCRYTSVSDVMILQLEFETAGNYYNLGVVDNKQTGSEKPWGVTGNLGGGTGGGIGTGCTAALPDVPVWVYVLIMLAAIAALVLIGWLGVRIVRFIFGGDSGSSVRELKREQRSQMRLLRYQANLERREENRQRRLDEKDAQRAQKAKDKQYAKRGKKTAENKRKAANSKNKKGKGGNKK